MKVGFAVDRKIIEVLQKIDFISGWSLYPFEIETFLASKAIISSDLVESTTFPSPLVFGTIISSCYSGMANEISSHLKQLVPRPGGERVIFVDPASIGSELSEWMARASSEYTKLILTQAASAERELATLRILYEGAQNRISEVERLPERTLLPRIHCQALPGTEKIVLGKSPRSFTLRQELDAAFSIDLFLSKRNNVTSGCLAFVELLGAETGRKIASWKIPELELLEGWNRFYCPVTNEPYLEQLYIRVHTSMDQARYALIKADHNTVSGVKMEAGQGAPFAFRIWRGVVGLKMPRLDVGFLPEGEAAAVDTSPVFGGSEFLHLGSPRGPVRWAGQIAWSERDGGLMVHPEGISPVVAYIQGIDVVSLSNIRVTCKLANEQAATTQFTIWIEPDDKSKRADSTSGRPDILHRARIFVNKVLLQNTKVPDDVVWLTLLAGETGECNLKLHPPYSGRLKLCLATRNLNEDNRYSWAVFTDIHFEHDKLSR